MTYLEAKNMATQWNTTRRRPDTPYVYGVHRCLAGMWVITKYVPNENGTPSSMLYVQKAI